MVIVKVTMSNGNTLCQYELNTVQDGEEVLTNTKRAIKAINPDLDVDIYDETNNSVEAVIHNIMYEEYKALGEAEYMIDDVLVEASPISFGAYCEKYSFDSTEYDCDVKGYDVKIFRDAESFHTVFMQRSLFERIAAKSNY